MLNCPIYCRGLKHSLLQRVVHQTKILPIVPTFKTFRLGVVVFLVMFILSSTMTLPAFDSIIQPRLVNHTVINSQVLAAHIVSPLPQHSPNSIRIPKPTPTAVYKQTITIAQTPTPSAKVQTSYITPTLTPTKVVIQTISAPNPTATLQPTTPQTQPTTAANSSSTQDAVNQLVKLINDARSSHGTQALSLSDKISNCALAHAKAMATRNSLFHDLTTDACDPSFHSIAENVGMSTEQPNSAVVTVHNSMMNEGPGGGHYENIINKTYTVVGIGIYFDGTTTWITEDFEG